MRNPLTNNIKLIDSDVSVFRILYLLAIYLTSYSVLNIIGFVCVAVLFVAGCCIFFRRFVLNRNYRKIDFYQYFILFVLLSIPGLFVGMVKMPINLSISTVMLLFSVLYLFVFFGIQCDAYEKAVREIMITARLSVIIIGVMNLLGFLVFFVFHREMHIFEGTLFESTLLVYENRYMGLFNNPNPAGYMSFFAIVCTLLLRSKSLCKICGFKVLKKRIAIPYIAMNATAIALCLSYGALMILMVFITMLMVFDIWKTICRRKVWGVILRIISVFVVCAGLILFNQACRIVATDISSADAIIKIDNGKDEPPPITFQRRKDIKFGSGRFDIYDDGWEIIKAYPLTGIGSGAVFTSGIGGGNLHIGNLFDFHNGYLTILTSSGVLAFAVIGYAMARIVLRMLRGAFRESKMLLFTPLQICSSFVVATLAYAFVEPSLFYSPSVNHATFWFVLSAGYVFLKKSPTYRPYKCGPLMRKFMSLIHNKGVSESENAS